MGCSMLTDNFKHDVLDLSSSIGGRSAEWNEIGFSLLMMSCVSFVRATNIAVLHLLVVLDSYRMLCFAGHQWPGGASVTVCLP